MSILRRAANLLLVLISMAAIALAAIFIGAEYGPLPLMIAAVVVFAAMCSTPTNSGTLGTARLADFVDLVLAGLFEERRGVLLGQVRNMSPPRMGLRLWALFQLPFSRSKAANEIFAARTRKPRWLRLPKHAGVHMAYVAPNGGGKSAGNVISNLLTDPASAIVMDFKGELLSATAYARMERFGHTIVCVAPFGLPSGVHFPVSRFNPFQLIDPRSRFFHDDAGAIANSLVIHSPNANNPFFDKSAEAVIHALASGLLIEAMTEECTLGELRDIISQPHKLQQMEDVMMSSLSEQGPLLRRLAGQMKGLEDRTRSDVIATANTHIRWLDSEPVAQSLAATDFNPGQLFDTSNPMTIYFHVPINRLHTYRGYIRTVFTSLTNYIFHAGESSSRCIRFYLDESYGLGPKLDSLYSALVFGRSYGINLNFYFQAISQISELFEGHKANDFLSNVHPVFTNVRDFETAKRLSAWMGRYTANVSSRQRGFNYGGSESHQDRQGHNRTTSYSYSQNQSYQQQTRELIQPEEILQLPRDTSIITLPHIPPILAEPVYYFKNKALNRWVKLSKKFAATTTETPVGEATGE